MCRRNAQFVNLESTLAGCSDFAAADNKMAGVKMQNKPATASSLYGLIDASVSLKIY
jgi:hypothetical protein